MTNLLWCYGIRKTLNKTSWHLSTRSHLLLGIESSLPKRKGKCRSPPLLPFRSAKWTAGARNMFNLLQLTAHNPWTEKEGKEGSTTLNYASAGLQPGISTADNCENGSSPYNNLPTVARSIGNARKVFKLLGMTARKWRTAEWFKVTN